MRTLSSAEVRLRIATISDCHVLYPTLFCRRYGRNMASEAFYGNCKEPEYHHQEQRKRKSHFQALFKKNKSQENECKLLWSKRISLSHQVLEFDGIISRKPAADSKSNKLPTVHYSASQAIIGHRGLSILSKESRVKICQRCNRIPQLLSADDCSDSSYDECSYGSQRKANETCTEKPRTDSQFTKVKNKQNRLATNFDDLSGDYKDSSDFIFYCSKCQNHPNDKYITGNLKQCTKSITKISSIRGDLASVENCGKAYMEYKASKKNNKTTLEAENPKNLSHKSTCRGKCGNGKGDVTANGKRICCQNQIFNNIDFNVRSVDSSNLFCCPQDRHIKICYKKCKSHRCHSPTVHSGIANGTMPQDPSSTAKSVPTSFTAKYKNTTPNSILRSFCQSCESYLACSKERQQQICCELHCFTGAPKDAQHAFMQSVHSASLGNRITSKIIDWNNTIKTNTHFTANDFQKFIRSMLPIVILFNMLPLLYAVTSDVDVSAPRRAANPVANPWIPLVAYLELLPRISKSPKCDQTFVSRAGGPQNGTFSAPLLHNPTNHSKQCLYIFLAGPGQRVDIVFTSFNLRGTPPDGSAVGELPACAHEYMDIYAEVQSSDPADLINSPFGGRYCGPIPPRRRISMYRAVALSFFTNKNYSTPELFEGSYAFINASEYEIGIPIAGSPCSYTVTPTTSINKTGALVSPTYPGAYPKDMSCTYQFLGESNQRVRLEFRDFDLFFGGPHCPFDYVKVYDGPDNSSALIGTYCGQQRNLVLYSSESSLFVQFFTLPRTANTQNRGFKGIYEFSESFVKLDFIRQNDGIHIRGSECDQKILSKKESSGYVFSPNYPYPYIPKTVCRYFVYGMQDAQHLERVRLEFSIFEIPRVESKEKGESNCTDGYLKVYLRGQETQDAYDKFDYELCGNESESVVSDGPRLAMVFSSGELQGRGFKAKYNFETEYKIPGTAAPDGTCSFTYRSTSKKKGELNSPRYPSNYPSDTNCSYMFHAAPNEQVTIVFDHFKVKADNVNTTGGAYGSSACFEDWLEMYVIYRDGPDRFLGRYCGLTAPGPVESPRGAVGLRILLHTDQENVASGFKARYVFEAAKSEFGDCGGNFSGQYSGIITSPNYPADYKGPSRGLSSNACNWYIIARLGYKLSLNFEFFSVEGDPPSRGCPAAVVRLWTNLDSDSAPVELCGEKSSVESWHYISQGQSARISFTTSDKTIGAQGFRIVWTEIQDSGPGPPASSTNLLCESSYHFLCTSGFCIADKLRCDGIKNCGPEDDSDEMHCTLEAPKEDHGVLIISSIIAGSFLICLLCTLCHRKRKRRHHRQLGLHRNAAHYDSTTSATGLSSSRRHLQGAGGSLSGSLHGIDPGVLVIPPAPSPPTGIPPPPHRCITVGVAGILSGAEDDDDDDEDNQDLFVNDVRFDDDDNNDESV